MKKRGFTLIELLAVIVVLAIIALIATPIVTNTIKEAKKRSTERGAENYLRQVEVSLALKRMNGTKVNDGKYEINAEGNICLNEECNELLEIEMSGEKPIYGSVVIENEEVNNTTTIEYNDYIVSYNFDDNKYEVNDLYKGILCTAVSELSTQKYYDMENDKIVEGKTGVLASEAGPYAYGVEYSCDLGDGEKKIFYVLEDGDTTELDEGRIAKSGEVSLIMNMNIDSKGKGTKEKVTVAWCSDETLCKTNGEWDNTKGPLTALRYLKNSISNWSLLSKRQVSLPTNNQILQTNGNLYYNLPTWLYENTAINDDRLRAYWISDNDPAKAYWAFSMDIGITYRYNIYNSDNIGVRPVITIKKSQLKYKKN